VSEEINLNSQTPHSENSTQDQTPNSPESWETQLQARVNELLAKRIAPFKSEIEQLQSTISALNTRLIEQAETEPTSEESSGLFDAVKQWFNDSTSKAEEDFKKRLEEARSEAASAVRAEMEEEFKDRLKQAAQDWENAAQMANETAIQKRLEQACADSAAIARRESEVQIEDLREQLEASRKALTLAVSSAQSSSASSSGFDQLRSAIDEIDSQRTQSETLATLVRRAAQFAPRIIFFVVKGGDAVGWKASGFDNGLNDESVRALTVPAQNPSLLQEALSGFRTAVGRLASPGENSMVLGAYGSPAPERAVAVPLVVRGKGAAVLYADSGTQSENSINTAAIETLMRVASMGIELLPARRSFDPPRPNNPGSQTSVTAAPAGRGYSSTEPATAKSPVPEQPSVQAPSAPLPEITTIVGEKVERVEQDERTIETARVTQPEWTTQVRTTEELIKPRGIVENTQEIDIYQTAQVEIESKAKPEPEPQPEPQPQIDEAVRISPPWPLSEEPKPDQVERAEVSFITSPPFVAPSESNQESFKESVESETTVPITRRKTIGVSSDQEREKTRPEERSVDAVSPATSFKQTSDFITPPEPPRPPAAPPAPPAPMVTVPTPASETEQRAHNDARRFARLLVSEIKLYNAAKVNEGRRNFDLYGRLKDEIDRSRKVYDKRVSPAVAARFDYFYDELVQTLAEGDPAKLGPGCPGPVVLAS